MSNTKQNLAFVFIHGIGSLGKHFDAIARALPCVKSKLFISRPGYDEKNSPICESLQDLSNLINSKINSFDYEEVVLIGHSFGGILSVLAANQNKKIKAVVLISSFLRFHLDLNGLNVSDVKILKNGFFKSTDNKIINNFMNDYKTINSEAILKEYLYCQNLDVSYEFSKLKIPVLIIHSFEDSVTAIRQAYKMFHMVEDSTLVILNKCGHNSIMEKPEDIAKYINEFVKII